jgi:hypothetical protein
MSDNRWQQVDDIFHRAVELAPQARSAFLDETCGADRSLRREVESLLAYESEDGAYCSYRRSPVRKSPETRQL